MNNKLQECKTILRSIFDTNLTRLSVQRSRDHIPIVEKGLSTQELTPALKTLQIRFSPSAIGKLKPHDSPHKCQSFGNMSKLKCEVCVVY